MKHEVTPFIYNGHNLSTITDDHGEVWFIAKEVAEILDYSDAHKMCERLDADEKQNRQIRGFGNRGVTLINESGLYSAILGSTKPEAKPFKKWVTSEVLPSIRKTGSYTAPMKRHAPATGSNPLPHVKAHLAVVSAMEKAGVRKEMAMAVALKAIHDDTGMTTEPYRLALPGVQDVCNLNQKQLGDLLGVSSRIIGKMLRTHGLMSDDESGHRIVTEKGRKFGEMKPFTNNGHSGYEPRWRKEVLDFLGEGAAA